MKGVRVIYLRFAWRRRKGKMRRLVKSWKFLSLHKNAEFIVPSYLFWAWNFHNKITTSKKCDLISLFLKRGKLCVFLFCTTNAETNKNRTGWPGDHGSNPQFPKQNTAPRRPRNPRELSLSFFFGLPVWWQVYQPESKELDSSHSPVTPEVWDPGQARNLLWASTLPPRSGQCLSPCSN